MTGLWTGRILVVAAAPECSREKSYDSVYDNMMTGTRSLGVRASLTLALVGGG